MKKSKLFAMMLMPAAFAACTNEDIIDGAPVNEVAKGDVIEDVLFSMSMSEGATTRGQYAGYAGEGADKVGASLFTNFYLEPEFDSKGALVLSDNKAFHGDMFGFCLSDGSQALTNLPFYIAGYGSKKPDGNNKVTKIFPFVGHSLSGNYYVIGENDNELYELAFHKNSYVVDATAMTKTNFDESVGAVKAKKSSESLADNVLDVRKAIVRNNAGVMSGNYIAYYPYNPNFYDRGAIPVVAYEKGLRLIDPNEDAVAAAEDAAASTPATTYHNLPLTQDEAIAEADFYGKLFAVSPNECAVTGKSRTGDIKLTPRTGAIFFQIFDATAEGGKNENAEVEIKRIIVEAQENSANTDFILDGKVALNNLMAIAPSRTSSIVGAQFEPVKVSGEAEYWAMVPCYPNLDGKAVQLKVYDNKGRVAVVKKSAVPTLGASVTYTVKVNELDFQATEREIFTAEDFVAEAETEGTLILMEDITVNGPLTIGKKLTIKGAHKLTLATTTTTTGEGEEQVTTTNAVKINEALTVDGSELILKNATIGADISSNYKVTLEGYASVAIDKKITAATLENKASVTLKNIDVTTLNNYGTIDFIYLKNAALKVTTLNNHNKLTVKQSTENKTETVLTVGTLNNKVNFAAHPTVIVESCVDGDNYRNAKLDATTINNEVYKNYPNSWDAQYKPAITINGLTSAATVTNKGNLTWSSIKDMNFTLTNQKNFTISANGKVTGSITNSGTFNVNSTVQLDGAVTTTGTTNVNNDGNLIAANAKFTVNGGTVNCYGTINGSSNIDVQKGDFIKYVSDKNNLQAALLTTGVAAKYNAIAINGDITNATVIKTDKTVYLDANLKTSGASEFKKLVSRGNITYTANGGATVESLEINRGTLTLNGTVININGTFTNKGTYSASSTAVVNCAGISGTGTWGKYPNF